MTKKANSKAGNYEVGYRRPPRANQFQPGTSGNPRGRRKGSRSIGVVLQSILSQKLTVAERGQTRRVERLEITLLHLANDAARGDPRALKLFLELIDRYGQPTEGNGQPEELSADDLRILAAYSLQARDPDPGQGDDQKEAKSIDADGL